MKNRPASKKGFVLITSILATSILIILALPYVSRVATEYRLMTKIYNSTSALDLAEAGIERALWEIGYNSSAFSGWTNVASPESHTIAVNSFTSSTGDVIGDYDAGASISADGMTATVTGTGYVPNRTKPDVKRSIKVVYVRQNFTKAVAALNGITMSGQAKTDSYDSSLGSYDSQPHTQQGDIMTNGSITLSGQAYVNGDANPGPDYPFSSVPPVSGSYGTLQAPFTVESIPASAFSDAQASNSNGNILLDGDAWTGEYSLTESEGTITLPGGTYYFTSINITGQALINVTGASTIYVDGGSVSISGQGIVNTGQPRDLLLYSSGSSISLSGQAAFAGAIYAPSATVLLTGQENFYGSIVCGSNIDSGQAKIHFDLNLRDVSPVFAAGRVTSWQET